MIHLNKLSLVLVVGMLLASAMATAQDSESMQLLRKYHPKHLTQDHVEEALASIGWQLKQLSAVQDTYRKSRDEISANISSLGAKIGELQKSLPPAVRFLDDEGRSTMASRATEQLLEARLELASLKSLVAQLESAMTERPDTASEVQKLELEMQQKAARSRLELAKSDYDAVSKQAKAQLASNRELQRARYGLEIAEAEFAIAAKKAQMINATASADTAKRLADVRVEVQPVDARIKTLEEFLLTLHQAAETIGEIKQLQRQQELWHKDLALVAQELFDATSRAIELRTFQSLVEGERESAVKSDDRKEGDDQESEKGR